MGFLSKLFSHNKPTHNEPPITAIIKKQKGEANPLSNLEPSVKAASKLEVENAAYEKQRNDAYNKFIAKYKLETLEDIEAVPNNINIIHPHEYNYTTEPEQMLGYRSLEFREVGNHILSIACSKKINEIMYNSTCNYPLSKYMYLVSELKKLRMFDEARLEEEKILRLYKPITIDLVARAIRLAKDCNTDLLSSCVLNSYESCCSECAKYRNRVYSISGKNKKFPFLSDIVKNCCCLDFRPYIDGISIGHCCDIDVADIAAYSNRPFIDERTDEQKKYYEKIKKEKEEKLLFEIKKNADKKDYDWLWEHMPEITPKSFGGYRKMKSSKSPNFLKLINAAKEKGYQIIIN